jgi:hypothetical protein
MSNYNGVIIYIDTSTDPDTGVSFADVQTVLGTNVNTESGLCTHENINRWSKYKPERHNGPMPISYRSRKDNNFGLEVPYCIEWQDMDWHINCMNGVVYDILFNIEDSYKAWKYLQPRGDRRQAAQNPSAEFYRLSDFARLPSDTTDPNYGSTLISTRGYNHNADVPFTAFLDMSGATPDITYDSVNRYQVNRTATSYITMTFINGRGDDIHLQDLINFDYNEGTGDNDIAWRPVIQVWNNDVVLNAPDDQDRLPWQQRNKPTLQIAGDPITTEYGASWSVSLPIGAGTYFDDYVNVNTLFRMCVGVGCCKKNPSASNAWKNDTDSLFIIPYDEEKEECPFYYEFKIVSHFDRDLQMVSMRYGNNTATFSNSTVEVPRNASGAVGFAMSIKQESSQKLHFVKYGQNPDSGYTALRIALEDPETHTLYYMIPTNSSYQATTAAYVPTGSGRVNLYGIPSLDGTSAAISVGNENLQPGQYLRYQVKVFVGDSSAENANSVTIHKLS